MCDMFLGYHGYRCFCESYDMKQHATKIFQEIVNGLGAFIQSQFVVQPQSPHSQPGSTNTSCTRTR